ncbi:MAG: helix-turn-helix domain-containing protein [Alphaproteobacteria bacterium]|nr:helix-turn-helix domain-containing protein [Alphaproteobacteria bacterium]
MPTTSIPDYFVYGETTRALNAGFLHVELVSARNFVHRGKVLPHKHPGMAQITFWFKGKGRYFIEDQSWTFSHPAASLVLADTVHGFEVNTHSDAIVLSLENAALENILNELGIPSAQSLFLHHGGQPPQWQALHLAMRNAFDEYEAQAPYWSAQVNYHAASAAIHLQRLGMQAPAPSTTSPPRPVAARLKSLINLHFRENWPIARYVGEIGASDHTALRATKAAFGSSIKNLVVQRRLLEAKRLLVYTIRSSEDIAYELGFKDPAYFNREFKKHTGFAPGVWRKQNAAFHAGTQPKI